MKLLKKKAFTLIELLVVITIIGILATGGVAVYTSQIQKARDTTRLNDVEALKSGVEQFYQDKSEYPSSIANFTTDVVTYVPKLPKDPKTGQICNRGSHPNGSACEYLYVVADDANGIVNGEYKISSAFENSGNVTEKAAKDGGVAAEDNRYEVGLNLTNAKSTDCWRNAAVTAPVSVIASTAAFCTQGTAVAGTAIIIAGN